MEAGILPEASPPEPPTPPSGPPRPPDHQPPATCLADIAEFSKELDALKTKWKQENEGLGGWIKKWGAIVGLFAGLIAIPKSAYDLYGTAVSRPNTTAKRGLPISMSYDATKETINFAFNTSMHNTGTADDTITQVWATFSSPSSSPFPAVMFDSSKFDIKDKGDRISLPFTIAKGAARDLAFTVQSPLESKSIPDLPGNWCLSLELKGESRASPITLKYSLFLPEDDISELKRSGIVLQFMTAD